MRTQLARHSMVTALLVSLFAWCSLAHAQVRTLFYVGNNFLGQAVAEKYLPNIDANWGVGSPAPGVPVDNFSVRFLTQLTPPASDYYQFCVVADDGVRLFINGTRIIDDWNDSSSGERCKRMVLSGGNTYSLELHYYERSGFANVKLLWSGNTITKQVIPSAVLGCCSDRNGVGGVYYPNANFSGPGIAIGTRQINFDWRTDAPIPGQPADNFSMRWTGAFSPRYTEKYTLLVTGAGSFKLKLNGAVLLDQPQEFTAGQGRSVDVDLEAGRTYGFELEYADLRGDAELRLEWSSYQQFREPIPMGAFFAQLGFGKLIDGSSYPQDLRYPRSAINVAGGATSWFTADTGENLKGGNTFVTTKTVATDKARFPAPDSVYQSERYGTFTYNAPLLAEGRRYTVRLHFAEIFWGIEGLGGPGTGRGTRLMDIYVQGTKVLSNFDVFAEAGGANRAIVKEFDAYSDGTGKLTIDFKPSPGSPDQNAKLSGIELIERGFAPE
jgi:hypothetical protein